MKGKIFRVCLVVFIFSLAFPIISSNVLNARESEPGKGKNVYAILVDWTGYFLKNKNIKQTFIQEVVPLFFPDENNPEQIQNSFRPGGFDPEQDLVFVARFGLLTRRARKKKAIIEQKLREPLRDYIQIEHGLKPVKTKSDLIRIARNLASGAGTLRAPDGQTGTQYGYPALAWMVALHRINHEAGDTRIEKITFITLTDRERSDQSIDSERSAVRSMFRKWQLDSNKDEKTFDAFCDEYTKKLEADTTIHKALPGVGQRDMGYLVIHKIKPRFEPTQIDSLKKAFGISRDRYKFGIQNDRKYHGTITVEPPLSFGEALHFERVWFELIEKETMTAKSVSESLVPGKGLQKVWETFPIEFGNPPNLKTYRLRLNASVKYTSEYLSRFFATLEYFVADVDLQEYLKDKNGNYIYPEDMEPGVTQEQAQKSINQSISFHDRIWNSIWFIIGIVLFSLFLYIVYVLKIKTIASLELEKGESEDVYLNLAEDNDKRTPAKFGMVSIRNTKSKTFRGKERIAHWTAGLRIVDVESQPVLVPVDGEKIIQCFVLGSDGEREAGEENLQELKKIQGEKLRTFDIHVLRDKIEDLAAPGFPDDDGTYKFAVTLTLKLSGARKLMKKSEIKIAANFKITPPKVKYEAQIILPEADEEGKQNEDFLYTEAMNKKPQLRRVSITMKPGKQAFHPVDIHLRLWKSIDAIDYGIVIEDCLTKGYPAEINVSYGKSEKGPEIKIKNFGMQDQLLFSVHHTLENVPPPTVRDECLEMQLIEVKGELPRAVGDPEKIWLRLSDDKPHPVVQLLAVKDQSEDGVEEAVIDYPAKADIDDENFIIRPAYPRRSKQAKDPWRHVASLYLGNLAQRPGESGDSQGKVCFKIEGFTIDDYDKEWKLTAAQWGEKFRLVNTVERDKNHNKCRNYLNYKKHFGHQSPAVKEKDEYLLEFKEYEFTNLKKELGFVTFTLTISLFLDRKELKRLKKKMTLPLRGDFGDKWLLLDLGTFAITAAVTDPQAKEPKILDLLSVFRDANKKKEELELKERKLLEAMKTQEDKMKLKSQKMTLAKLRKRIKEAERDADKDVGIEENTNFLPSHVFLSSNPENLKPSMAGKPEFVEYLREKESKIHDGYYKLPPLKLLVGGQTVALNDPELRKTFKKGLKVDDVLKSAVSNLFNRYIQSHFKTGNLPNQILMSVPNTFTPAHTSLIRKLIKDSYKNIDRVVFLSESDAVCRHYIAESHKLLGEEFKRFHDGYEYALVADIGAGTSDFSYVCIKRNKEGELEWASIIHREGFRMAGNNVDTCMAKIFHHKLKQYAGLPGSTFLYKPEKWFFKVNGTYEIQNDTVRVGDKLLNQISIFKQFLNSGDKGDKKSLTFKHNVDFYEKKPGEATENRDFTLKVFGDFIKLDTTTGNRHFFFKASEFINAPAFKNLISRDMSRNLINHFFQGCPKRFEGHPPGWCKEDGTEFPIDTVVFAGRGSLTPGLKEHILYNLGCRRLDKTHSILLPDLGDGGKNPHKLKLAVLYGAHIYATSSGADRTRSEIREAGLYEDYYLYTGQYERFNRCYPILKRDDVFGKRDKIELEPGCLVDYSFKNKIQDVEFMHDNSPVVIISTSGSPPENPFDLNCYVKPLCQFTQNMMNSKVNISFSITRSNDYDLRVNHTRIEGRETRYDNSLMEDVDFIREGLWPALSCDEGGNPLEYYALFLPDFSQFYPGTFEDPGESRVSETGDEIK